MTVFYTHDGDRWETVAVSDVGERLNDTPADEGKNCLICLEQERERPATAMSLFTIEGAGEPRVASMNTCAEHTGQWVCRTPIYVLDGESQRWN